MSYLSIDARCSECDSVFPALVDRDNPDEPVPCKYCPGVGHRTISAPTVLKASWPDGYREKNHADFVRLKEASKLECELAKQDANRKAGDRKQLKELKELKDEIKSIKKAPAKNVE